MQLKEIKYKTGVTKEVAIFSTETRNFIIEKRES